jgi:hypothetical protein
MNEGYIVLSIQLQTGHLMNNMHVAEYEILNAIGIWFYILREYTYIHFNTWSEMVRRKNIALYSHMNPEIWILFIESNNINCLSLIMLCIFN